MCVGMTEENTAAVSTDMDTDMDMESMSVPLYGRIKLLVNCTACRLNEALETQSTSHLDIILGGCVQRCNSLKPTSEHPLHLLMRLI